VSMEGVFRVNGTANPASLKDRRGFLLFNRGAGIRTRDLLLPKQARYRTAPRPVDLL
jgi:hypothetical protein